LPPVTIYQARTISALAALLEEPTTPRFPALVLLKEGAEKPRVFLTHGRGDSVIDFFQPIKHIESDLPTYGPQAKGIGGLDEPLERIEDMAEFHVNAIRELHALPLCCLATCLRRSLRQTRAAITPVASMLA
jgi:hypothetical protein